MANYLKQGTNDVFITDNAEIELAKFNNLRFSVLGYMLGDFDEHGVYTVDEGIAKELINMRKYVVSTVDNVEICHSEIRLNRPITFLVTFEEDCATLSLIEKIGHEGNYKDNGGSVSDINEYVLDKIQTSGIINKDVVYRRWHIGEFAGTARDVASLDEETKAELLGVINRFKYLLYMNNYLLEKEEELEEQELAYAENMRMLLVRYPKLDEAVKKSVKEKLVLKKDFVRVDKPFVVRTINEVMEQAILENLSVLKPEELKMFNEEKHVIANEYNLHVSQIVQAKVEKPLYNAENSVGKVLADTSAMLPTTLVSNLENAERVASLQSPEQSFTIEELRKGLDSSRLKTEERLFDEAVGLVSGQDKTKSATQKQNKLQRLEAVVDSPVDVHVSAATKKQAEEITAKKAVAFTAEKTANKGLIAKAVAPLKSAAPKAAGGVGKTAGSGGKSAGGSGKGGKSSGGKDTAKKDDKKAKNKDENKPKPIPRVDKRIAEYKVKPETDNSKKGDVAKGDTQPLAKEENQPVTKNEIEQTEVDRVDLEQLRILKSRKAEKIKRNELLNREKGELNPTGNNVRKGSISPAKIGRDNEVKRTKTEKPTNEVVDNILLEGSDVENLIAERGL